MQIYDHFNHLDSPECTIISALEILHIQFYFQPRVNLHKNMNGVPYNFEHNAVILCLSFPFQGLFGQFGLACPCPVPSMDVPQYTAV